MPITSLDLFGCDEVHDLTPLAGMPLTRIALTPANMTSGSLNVLRQCKTLRNTIAGQTGRDSYTTQDFWKKFDGGDFRQKPEGFSSGQEIGREKAQKTRKEFTEV